MFFFQRAGADVVQIAVIGLADYCIDRSRVFVAGLSEGPLDERGYTFSTETDTEVNAIGVSISPSSCTWRSPASYP